MNAHYLETLLAFVVIILGLSLVITVLTQLASALLGLRGTNLRWGIETLLKTADPELEPEDAKAVAERVLRHSLISDSTFSRFLGWKWAQGLVGRWKLATAIRLEEFINVAEDIANGPDPDEQAALVKANLDRLKDHANTWFKTMMDRVAQRFAMSTRMWTVLFAFILAAVLQVDSIVLLRKLSQDEAMRNSLVASADRIYRESAKVLGEGDTNVYMTTIEQLKTRNPDAKNVLTNKPSGLSTLETANLWLRKELAGHPQKATIMNEYQQLLSSNVIAQAPGLMGSIGVVQDELAKAGIDLLPKPINWGGYSPFRLSFWGMLLTAVLLSLGAPFWFNSLKTLMTLRPVLATQVHKEAEKKQKPG